MVSMTFFNVTQIAEFAKFSPFFKSPWEFLFWTSIVCPIKKNPKYFWKIYCNSANSARLYLGPTFCQRSRHCVLKVVNTCDHWCYQSLHNENAVFQGIGAYGRGCFNFHVRLAMSLHMWAVVCGVLTIQTNMSWTIGNLQLVPGAFNMSLQVGTTIGFVTTWFTFERCCVSFSHF